MINYKLRVMLPKRDTTKEEMFAERNYVFLGASKRREARELTLVRAHISIIDLILLHPFANSKHLKRDFNSNTTSNFKNSSCLQLYSMSQ